MAASELESISWQPFDSFSASTISIISSDSIDSLSKNSSGGGIDTSTDGQLSDVINLNFKEEIQSLSNAKSVISECFPVNSIRTDGDLNKNDLSDVLRNDELWNKLLNNYGKRLPVSWRETKMRASLLKQLLLEEDAAISLELNPLNSDDLSEEDEDLTFDMHAMQSSFQVIQSDSQDFNSAPLFTAEQVIREIEEMMSDSPPPDLDNSSDANISFKFSKLPETDEYKSRLLPVIPVIGEEIESMSVLDLCELYDELETCVRHLSERLIEELAYRDELEYDKEIKNRFISVFLSIQHKRKDLMSSALQTTNKNYTKTNGASNTLNTVIPYDDEAGAPSSALLGIYIKILKAMVDESPLLPQLLTDYILKVVCPTT